MNASYTRESYTPVEARNEALRCLSCDDPYCNKGCPAEVDVRAFVRAVATGNLTAAARELRQKNVLPLSCAMICATERQCEERCRSAGLCAPISIARIQRYVSEQDIEQHLYTPPKAEPKGAKVAVVGSGPAGLAAAAELTSMGYAVTVFEKADRPGGMLSRGIPEYRLAKDDVAREVNYLAEVGFEIKCGAAVESVDALLGDGYAAVLIATGLWGPARLGIPGEELKAVLDAVRFLQACIDTPDAVRVGPRVIVIGGGSVAMDAACSALRQGAKTVEICCLESPAEMPGTRDEIARAWDEGVIFHSRVMPQEILSDSGHAAGLRAVRIEWQEPDNFAPSNAVELPDSEFVLHCDTVIVAIGQRPGESAQALIEGLGQDRGRVAANDESYMTSRPGVFAAGDIRAGGGQTVVRAIYEGKHAAAAIDAYLAKQQ